LDANNVGAFYRFANKRLNNKTGVGPLYNAHDDEVVVSDIDRANLLNTYFSIIGTVDNGNGNH